MQELYDLLSMLGLPVAYNHFAEGEAPNPPYIVYLEKNSTNFPADGKVYFKKSVYNVELYTDKKDPVNEGLVETLFDGAGIFYNKSETWIDSEKLYEVLYTMEV